MNGHLAGSLALRSAGGAPPLIASGVSRSLRRIAHISDTHILEANPRNSLLQDLALRLVSLGGGRRLDLAARRERLRSALAAAVRSSADHLVISGDLTELGTEPQFDAFAEALRESGFAPEQVTLVPGNHDAYTDRDGWTRALAGPLRPYRRTSAGAAGKSVDRGELILLPLDVARYQPITRSAGELTVSAFDALRRRLEDPWLKRRTVVLVQHHSPFAHETSAWQWMDGLQGCQRLIRLLEENENVSVLHGHLHRGVDRTLGDGRVRVFGAPATVDDRDTPRVRLYEFSDGTLRSVGVVAAPRPNARSTVDGSRATTAPLPTSVRGAGNDRREGRATNHSSAQTVRHPSGGL